MTCKFKFHTLVVVIVALFALAVTGCNTANGLGKDVEKLGDKIQQKAR